MTSGVQRELELRQEGFEHTVKQETVIRDGKEYTKTTLADRDDSQLAGKVSRIMHGAGCVLGSVLNVSEGFRNATWGVASEGRKEKIVLTGGNDPLDRERRVAVKAPDQEAVDAILNHYDLKDPAAVQRLRRDQQLEHIRDQLIPDGSGNFYLPVNDSSFIFVPEGDFSKLTVTSTGLTNLIVRLGYDPKIRSSIQNYLERPDVWKRIIVKNGNYYLPEERRDGTSCYFFVPKGDMSKATSLKVSKSKTGEALKGSTFEKVMFTYGLQHEGMIKGIEKEAEETVANNAKKLGKDKDKEEDKDWFQREKMRILKSYRVAVVSPRGSHTRIYGEVDPNAQDIVGNRIYNSPFGGIRIDFDTEPGKEIDELWEKKPDDKLTTDRPFADSNRAPAISNPNPPLSPRGPGSRDEDEKHRDRDPLDVD